MLDELKAVPRAMCAVSITPVMLTKHILRMRRPFGLLSLILQSTIPRITSQYSVSVAKSGLILDCIRPLKILTRPTYTDIQLYVKCPEDTSLQIVEGIIMSDEHRELQKAFCIGPQDEKQNLANPMSHYCLDLPPPLLGQWSCGSHRRRAC